MSVPPGERGGEPDGRRAPTSSDHDRAGPDSIRTRLLRALRRIDDPVEIQRTAARLLGEHLDVARTCFASVDGTGHLTVLAEHSASLADTTGRHLELHRLDIMAELARGRTVVVDDMVTDRRWAPSEAPAPMSSIGARSLVAVPIEVHGHVDSVLVVVDSAARTWLPSDIALLQETAVRTRSDVERAEALRMARFRERQLHHVLDSVPSVLFTTDADGHVEMTLGQVHSILGVDADDVVGTLMWPDLIHPSDRSRAVAAWRRSRAAGEEFEARYRIADRACWVLVRAVPIYDDGRLVNWFGTITDVHALVTAERALEHANATLEERVRLGTERARQLASSLSRSEHDERRRLGQILHDDLQQILYSLQLKVNGIVTALEHDDAGEAATRLLDVQGRLQGAIDITRSLTIDLSPPLLTDDDLDEALQWLVTHMADLHGLSVSIDSDESISVDDDLRVMLFHIARELLFNVAKHGGTDEASVSVRRLGDDLEMVVRDRGRGFDPDTGASGGDGSGFGLLRVRERLQVLGGELDVDTGPGRGCTVVVTVPVDPDQRNPEGVAYAPGGDAST